MKYLLLTLALTACSNERVAFCVVDEPTLTWACSKTRTTKDPKRSIMCRKDGMLPWICYSTSGGLTVEEPTKYIKDFTSRK